MARLPRSRVSGASSNNGERLGGYCNPPKAAQFKKGQSGNPHGSSRKVRERKAARESSPFDQIMLDESARLVPITENGKRTQVSVYQAASRGLMLDAAKGDRRAQRLVIDQVQAAHDRRQAAAIERFGLLVQHHTSQIVARNNPTPPAPHEARYWPHPDDVVLDYARCIGEIVGPIDVRQAAPFIELSDEYRLWQARLCWLETNPAEPGILRDIQDVVTAAIAELLDRIRHHMPPSFRAVLEWPAEEGAIGLLEVEGTSGTTNLALVAPDSAEMAYYLYLLFADAQSLAETVPARTRLSIADNTASLINRLQIERQAENAGMAPAVAVPEFGQFYEAFAAEDPGIGDEAQG